MGTDTFEVDLDTEDPATLKSAFETVLPHLKAIPAEKVCVPRINLKLAATTALNVAAKVNQPAWRAAFGKLPPDYFDPSSLDLLDPAARALMYVSGQAADAAAVASEAKLPEKLASEATELREVMLRLYDYHLGRNPDEAAKIADLRAGRGYADLAADLVRLAQTYRANEKHFAKDPSFYAPGDADRAELLAANIQTLLGAESTNAQRDLLARAWTFLSNTYEQIAKPGRWIFDGSIDAEVFVSLIGAGRRPRRKKAETPTANG